MRGQRLGQRQCCCVQSARRRVRRCCGGCVCWCHAGQRQRAGELRRSECELCCCEQCREQRGCECDGCGAGRSGCERRKQQGASRRDCVCGERVAERQRGCVPQRVWRVCRLACCCVVWSAAWQREPCAELQRACCELCRAEQRREQRGLERDCCGPRRDGLERFLCDCEGWSEWMRRERVEERQRSGVPQRQRAARGGFCVGVDWRAAGQLECRCELRRAERELCWCEQCREQRRLERQCCWARRDGRERVERRRAAGAQRVRGQRLGQRQCCCVQSGWRRF